MLAELGSSESATAEGPSISSPPDGAASWEPRFEPGDQIGSYRIERLLGHGGTGEVYVAEHINGRRVALKVLHRRLRRRDDRARFLVEAQLTASVVHPNVVYVFEATEIAEIPAIVMEWLPGGTLKDRVKANGALAAHDAVDAIMQVIDGLAAASTAGILHRDIKPSNCFVDADGTIKIGDFGLSIASTADTQTGPHGPERFQGTPGFTSPEQMRGERVDVRSDVYAVGATLYYLLTGQTPRHDTADLKDAPAFAPRESGSLRRGGGAVPRGLDEVLARCLREVPDKRYGSYDELRHALEPFRSRQTTPAPLSVRLAAGLVDLLVPFAVAPVLMAYLVGSRAVATPAVAVVCAVLLPALAYWSVSEAAFGRTLGKRVFGLSVETVDGRRPPLRHLIGRRAIVFLPALWTAVWAASLHSRVSPATAWLMGVVLFVGGTVAIFAPARRRNGFSGLHDLLTRVRVVVTHLDAHRTEPLTGKSVQAPAKPASGTRLGPYEIAGALGDTDTGQLFLGRDPLLCRSVWIHVVPPGTPALSETRRTSSSPGRLRWLNGQRTPFAAWDAYEACDGRPLALIQAPQPWARVRTWLRDLAITLTSEVASPRRDIGHVWIANNGRIKLLDFRAAGLPSTRTDEESSRLSTQALLSHVATHTLGDPAPPLPVPARTLLNHLARERFSSLVPVIEMLDRLTQSPDRVTGARRNLVVTASVTSAVAGALLLRSIAAHLPWPVPGLTSAICVAAALACALVFRSGVWLHAFGIAVVTADGREASRTRAAFRALAGWIWLPCWTLAESFGWYAVEPLVLVLTIFGFAWLTSAPERGPQDWIAGTFLVPR